MSLPQATPPCMLKLAFSSHRIQPSFKNAKDVTVRASRCRQACQQGAMEKSTLVVAAAMMQATPLFRCAQSCLHIPVSLCASVTMNP